MYKRTAILQALSIFAIIICIVLIANGRHSLKYSVLLIANMTSLINSVTKDGLFGNKKGVMNDMDDTTRMIFDHETLWQCEACQSLLEIKRYSGLNSVPKVYQISDSIMIRFCPCCGRKIVDRIYRKPIRRSDIYV